MFSYYGSKSKLAKLYPEPEYDIIVEPFAGTARYSLMYPHNFVWLNDKWDVIAGIWKYLVSATEEQISSLPDMNKGDDLRDIPELSEAERNLMGFMMSRGLARPTNIYTGWAADGDEIGRSKRRIIEQLDDIRHWYVTCRDYKDLPDITATWYIDPPYQYGGSRYIMNHMNYDELSEWCLSRKGQVIVCESSGADWLPFSPLKEFFGQRKTRTEMVWTNHG